MPTSDPAKQLARELAALRKEVRSSSRGSQAAYRSIQVDGQSVTLPEIAQTGQAAVESAQAAKIDAATAIQRAEEATTSAQDAASLADQAQAAALEAAGIAASAGKIVYTASEPAADYNTLWIKPPDNIPYRWDGDSWEEIRDGGVTSAVSLANQAVAAAGDAQAAADGKVRSFFQDAAPTGMTAADVGDLWFQTNAGNKLSRWTGTAWVPADDTRIATAVTNAGSALSVANTKITTFYTSSAPTATATGDLWVDTGHQNQLKRWSGSAWVDARDTTIATAQAAAVAAQNAADSAISKAADAQATADGKVFTYFASTAPTGLVAADVGDLWFDTANQNKLSRWSGTAWVAVADTRIAAAVTAASDAATAAGNAQSTANSKIVTFYTGTAPSSTGRTVGDLWVDTSNGNLLKRWSGSAWVDARDTTIATAQTAATNARNVADQALANAATADAKADGKVKTYFQDTAPTGLLAVDVGDLWFQTNAGNKMSRWSGTAWVASPLGSAAITATARELGSITTYYTATAPTSGMIAGDLWVNTTTNALSRYGTSWVLIQDAGIKAAADAAAAADKKAADAATAAQTAQNTASAASGKADTALTTAQGKNTVTYSTSIPSNTANPGIRAGDLWFQRATTGPGSVITGTWEWSGTAWQSRVFGDAILNSLTVGKLVTGEIAAGQKIIAGPANGTHAEMSSTGFRVFADDPGDGIPNEVIRLGTDTDDFFAVTGANGQLLATVDETGRGTFSSLNIQGDITIKGAPLLATTLQNRPKGVVAWGIGTPDRSGISAETRLFGVTFTSEPGRFYRITVSGIRFSNAASGSGNGIIWLIRESGTGYEYGRGNIANAIGAGFSGGHSTTLDVWTSEFDVAQSRTLEFSIAPSGSTVWAQYDGNDPYVMVIEDLGPRPPSTGNTYATPVPEAAKTTYSETIPASWGQSYKGDGSVMTNADGRLYQGQDPTGSNGNLRSLLGFPDLTARLAGATLNRAEIFLYAGHWYNNGGGTAVIGAHASTSPPGTFSGVIDTGRIQSGGWPKPGARLIDVTGWDWKGGSVRGVVLGPGPSTDGEYYGYFNGPGQAYFPELRITYTK